MHGFRATGSTVLIEKQFNPDLLEMQLAHFDSSVRGIDDAAKVGVPFAMTHKLV